MALPPENPLFRRSKVLAPNPEKLSAICALIPSMAVNIPTKEEIPMAMMAPVKIVRRMFTCTDLVASRIFSIKFIFCPLLEQFLYSKFISANKYKHFTKILPKILLNAFDHLEAPYFSLPQPQIPAILSSAYLLFSGSWYFLAKSIKVT